MNRWKGLFKKEWLLMNGWFYATMIATVLLAFIFPVLATLYLDTSSNLLSEGFIFLAPIWLILNVFIPTIILMVSLGKESRRPDIWLHSPASVFQLFSAKLFFSMMTGAVNFLISLILITALFSFRIQPIQFVFDNHTQDFWILFLSVMFFASIMLLFIGLFFHVLYLVLLPYTKKFTTAITFGILILFVWLEKIVTALPVYQKTSTFGKFWSVSESRFHLVEDATYFRVDESFLYVGEILLSVTFAGILFVVASVLFEKKVRL
ncbi:hypothetical protein [Sporosarcina ureilytica]|uniref:ABC transporter permease n=1 Tax=Sporosarcina ureilytica TaxID=298596 RepID=A0A1D8JCI8_9BACL|nr:hypothetical protein [Sporosarcina ureilytica]AOV06428.1 hypothetical protein BI350_01600 [Sporosarcina ureilytica]